MKCGDADGRFRRIADVRVAVLPSVGERRGRRSPSGAKTVAVGAGPLSVPSPTALRCSSRGRVAELATLTSFAALKQPRRVSLRSALARADLETALLVATDI